MSKPYNASLPRWTEIHLQIKFLSNILTYTRVKFSFQIYRTAHRKSRHYRVLRDVGVGYETVFFLERMKKMMMEKGRWSDASWMGWSFFFIFIIYTALFIYINLLYGFIWEMYLSLNIYTPASLIYNILYMYLNLKCGCSFALITNTVNTIK